MNAVVSTVRSTCWPSPRWLGGLLVVLTLAVFWPVRDFQFVNYDDPEYVTANPHVFGGLTASNVAWAFTTGEMGSWHPLTWLSLQADAQFFGVSPRAFHLTNLALHLANTLLVFSLLLALTGAQLCHWRDSETLFTHAAAVTRGNYLAENNLGVVHLERGEFAVAAERFRAALRPGYPFAHNNLGLALAASDQSAAAETEFHAAIQSNANYAEAHRNLGTMLARRGEFAAAVVEYQLAFAHGLATPELRDNLTRAQAALK
jgi:tetratricopeptide (TPR) repeat protein